MYLPTYLPVCLSVCPLCRPVPQITWRDGSQNREIVNGTGGRVMSRSAHKLTIKKLTDDDQGYYSCKAENAMDSMHATIFLNVTCECLYVLVPGGDGLAQWLEVPLVLI